MMYTEHLIAFDHAAGQTRVIWEFGNTWFGVVWIASVPIRVCAGIAGGVGTPLPNITNEGVRNWLESFAKDAPAPRTAFRLSEDHRSLLQRLMEQP